MRLKVYSVRDSKGGIYHPPMFLRSHGEAERAFNQVAKDTTKQIGQYPEDYDLFYLGEYDDTDGKLHPLDSPSHIIKAVDSINRSSN